MTTGQRRDRVVYFRVSEKEFHDMIQACGVKGVRSLSELARNAVKQFIQPQEGEAGNLAAATQALESVLGELRQIVSEFREPGGSHGGRLRQAIEGERNSKQG